MMEKVSDCKEIVPILDMAIDKVQQNILGKDEKVFSVSEYLGRLNITLKSCRAKIIGEVSEVNFGPTGHAYFVLKDEKDGSIIQCVIWKPKYDLYGVELKQGVEIIASGCPNVHLRYGFKFVAEIIEYAGEGILKEEYEKLKKKLTQEGVFEKERKRLIPEYPQCVGVITSKAGAVIHDFTTNLGKFGFKIKMYDSRVEGQDAVEDILRAINSFKKQEIEVLVIMRGGGSFESMLAFNNEEIIRQVVNFPVPVIAGIGHEKNIPLMSLAADVMVSTPTAAANCLSESWEQAESKLEKCERNILNLYSKDLSEIGNILNGFYYRIRQGFGSILSGYIEIENKLKTFLSLISNRLTLKRKDILNISKSILKCFISGFDDINDKIFNSNRIISSYNPERQLKLGYSITKHNNFLIKNTKDVKIGDEIEVQVFDGFIESKVKKINKKYA